MQKTVQTVAKEEAVESDGESTESESESSDDEKSLDEIIDAYTA